MPKTKRCLISHDKQTSERCMFCNLKINLSWRERVQLETKAVPRETKQRLLDLMWDEHKSLGEAREMVGVSLDVAGEILMENIHEMKYIGRTAV